MFDLDGTLIDPKLGIITSIQYALEKMGVQIPPADSLDWCIGPPLHLSLGKLLSSTDDATVMVGDREHDIVAAAACLVRSFGVTYGYGSVEELKAARADYLFDSLLEFADALPHVKQVENHNLRRA